MKRNACGASEPSCAPTAREVSVTEPKRDMDERTSLPDDAEEVLRALLAVDPTENAETTSEPQDDDSGT